MSHEKREIKIRERFIPTMRGPISESMNIEDSAGGLIYEFDSLGNVAPNETIPFLLHD